MRLSMGLSSLLLVLSAAACGSTPPVAPEAPPAPVESDAGIAVPDSGYWERTGPGLWTYDLGLGFPADLQLGANPPGQGLMRVALPAGAAHATITAMRVMYARNATDMSEDGQDPTASGEATWTFFADAAGQPGGEIDHLDVTIDAKQALPLGDGGEPVVHAVPGVSVPAVFWVGFRVRSGEPRVGGMRVNTPDGVQYTDLFFRRDPNGPLGDPVNVRPYVGLSFEGLSATPLRPPVVRR